MSRQISLANWVWARPTSKTRLSSGLCLWHRWT